MTFVERVRFFVLVALLVAAAFVWLPTTTGFDCSCLTVSFIDVGQGDAILIQTPDGHEMLIDGGPDAGVLREMGKLRSFFDKDIDVVVASHPDLDHIGGLVDVFNRFNVQTFIETTNINDTPAAAALAAAAEKEDAVHIYAEAGQIIELGEEVYVQILAPSGDEANWPSNNASIVLRIVYGEVEFMLTGDLPAEIEDHLVDLYGNQLESDVLKLGHHGSKTSTSEAWLDAVSPRFAVVSAAIDNRYGHPHQEVMQRVFARDIETRHTGTDGTVTFQSDGKSIIINK